ncbi:hypothetical protein [Gilvibacter sediminis]|uniref:hypothetical protein n=1 Tax=Gilvibacter sediminis TaxID=379071 RepID=UPI00234FF528|nr:hypothetical protein [Gilvibacter sediminis]MDC7998407.1 hypothetical protein [Gilvibacter sediminis]
MRNLLLVLFFSPLYFYAQSSINCGNTNSIYGKKSYHTGSTGVSLASGDPFVFNIYFHNEQDIIELTENDYLRAVAYLNQVYNQFDIFFKYRGFVEDDPTPLTNMFNILVRETAGDGSALTPNFINISYTTFLSDLPIISHEVGHILGLSHTFQGSPRTESTFVDPLTCEFDPVGTQRETGYFFEDLPGDDLDAENVTRDTSSPDYNAAIAGDFVVDTPATFQEPNVCSDPSTGISYYIYSDEVVDETGTPYLDIDVRNIMSYNEFQYLDNLTIGQGVRMRETIANETILQDRLTTIESLYEPYSGIYRTCCWQPEANENPPRFQPGFDYEFVACSDSSILSLGRPLPWPYDDLTFNTGDVVYSFPSDYDVYEDIVHLNNTAIRIVQLEETPRRCYSNLAKNANSGTIVKFNDGVFNANVTATAKDSLGINDPNLVNNLENGLFLIETNFDDGTQDQKVILKDNE